MKTSKRRYVIQTSIGNTSIELLHPKIQKIELFQPTIQEIINNTESEVYFALQDELDLILDLRQGESMYFQPNRDDSKSKGIITRIK